MLSVVGALALMLGGACSSPTEDCAPPIPAGTRFRVILGSETASSDRCHIVQPLSTFDVTAAAADATTPGARCQYAPAAWAPQQTSVNIANCTMQADEMLATYCDFTYKSSCPGNIKFSFTAPPGVDWNAPIIDGAIFRIRDYASSCLPDTANCLDEWSVRLERIP